ncbi:MAG: KH domain-containing protein [Elusimicrobia bacterium]|nr:KH domain-containing protein [Elusimicrobiota bacterium]
MKEAMCYLLNNLLEKREQAEIEYEEQGSISRFKIKVDPADRGKIIGKDGKIIRSLRNIFSIVGRKNNKKVFIEIV